MLDEKIKQQQILNQVREDVGESKAISARNREEIIRLQIRLSQLQSLEEKMGVDYERLHIENEFYKVRFKNQIFL